MKIIYSELKKMLPGLKKNAKQLVNDLTMIGHFCEGFQKTNNEEIISLEIRQNRGDCLSYYGIAKELSVLYNIPIKVKKFDLPKAKADYDLPIMIKAKDEVKRILAIKISNLKNKPSPKWLKDFLAMHQINSINTLVDLTNFITFWYGIPCHAFDTDKSGDQLTWQLNTKEQKEFITLDGSVVELEKDTFVINDKTGVASLVMLGGRRVAIDLNTQEALIEMAIYDRGKVRKDSKSLGIITEAGIRLDKELDTELIPQAFAHLIQLIIKNCGGEVNSNLFEEYNQKPKQTVIEFDPKKPAKYAGIEIKKKLALEILRRLDCQIKIKQENIYQITPPSLRKDLECEEDLIEEVIRFFGYDKIPTNQPIEQKKLADITPPILKLIKSIKNFLVNTGYDEIRSWPLIQEKHLIKAPILGKNAKPIYTQNSINANYPVLRQSIISSLILQQLRYQRYKVENRQFFEIGKIFYKEAQKFLEKYSLGICHDSKTCLEETLKQLAKKLKIAINYQIINHKDVFMAEIDLDKISSQIKTVPEIKLKKPTQAEDSVQELTSQIITLDANVFTKQKSDPEDLIKKYQKIIGEQNLWQIKIIDIYQDKSGYKYTLRVSYFNISDKEAKKIHLSAFNLA